MRWHFCSLGSLRWAFVELLWAYILFIADRPIYCDWAGLLQSSHEPAFFSYRDWAVRSSYGPIFCSSLVSPCIVTGDGIY